MSDDTIDITDLVSKTRSTFVEWAVMYAYGQLILVPGLTWMALPVVKSIVQWFIQIVVNDISNAAVMEGFFLNTAIRKATQADDFVQAVNAKNNLPKDASDDEYNQAERVQMDSFRNFVAVTN